MFGDYTISLASRHPSSFDLLDDDEFFLRCSRPVSPRTTMTSDPSGCLSVAQLSASFGQQSLDCAQARDGDRMSAAESAAQLESVMASPMSYCWAPQPRRRAQRQRDVRMQCDPLHLRSISELVQRMVDAKDQCTINAVDTTESLPSCPSSPGQDDMDAMSPARSDSMSTSSRSSSRPASWALSRDNSLRHRPSDLPSLTLTATQDHRVRKRKHRRG